MQKIPIRIRKKIIYCVFFSKSIILTGAVVPKIKNGFKYLYTNNNKSLFASIDMSNGLNESQEIGIFFHQSQITSNQN